MTKPEVLQVLFSLAAGNYIMQGKEVVVTPIRIANLRRGKFYHINDGGNYVEFKIMYQRDGIYIEDLVVKGDIKDLEDFIGSLLPEPSTFEQEMHRESLEILLLILLIISILSTPVTIVTFIYQYAWAWGFLAFTTTMFIWSAWIFYKIGKLP